MSAPTYKQLPKPSGPEFCVAGRSNVGKSSFMNHLFGQHDLARVSKKPGKTIAANYYRLDTKRTIEIVSSEGTFLVDLLSNAISNNKGQIIFADQLANTAAATNAANLTIMLFLTRFPSPGK